MEPSSVYFMRHHQTVQVLVSAVMEATDKAESATCRKAAASVYVQDQVAAVLANMAANVDCRQDVIDSGGIPVLLRFLQAEPPRCPERPDEFAQVAATERILQKSAIAISRYLEGCDKGLV